MQIENETMRKHKKFNGKKGDVYGRLTLTGKTFMSVNYYKPRRMVEAECECGIVRDYLFELLRRGESKSCGCLRREVTGERATTHGLTQHPLYDVFNTMISRCFRPDNKAYPDYGGRGITVCDEWQDNFEVFYAWCINNGWAEGLDLDRRYNDGNYSPLNCRFVTRKESNRNKRSTRFYEAFGETKCLFDWGDDPRCKVGIWTLRSRMDKEHWQGRFEEAMTIKDDSKRASKVGKHTKQLTAFGETKNITDWSKDKRCVVGFDRLRDRIAWGWEHKKAITTIQEDNKEIKLTAFGESKSMTNWLKDERCVVKRDALRDRYRKGWNHEDCITIPSKTGFKITKAVTESAR